MQEIARLTSPTKSMLAPHRIADTIVRAFAESCIEGLSFPLKHAPLGYRAQPHVSHVGVVHEPEHCLRHTLDQPLISP